MKKIIFVFFMFVLLICPTSLYSSRDSRPPTIEETLENDIEMQLSQVSYSTPMDIPVINEMEINAVLHQSFEKNEGDGDDIENTHSAWCGKKLVYGTISDLLGLATLICAGVGAAKLSADGSSSVGHNLTFAAAGLSAAQTFFKKLQDNETTQQNNQTKKVAKSTLAANVVLLDKMVQQSKTYNEKLKEQAMARQFENLKLIREKKIQIKELLAQHDKDLDELQTANDQVESMRVLRKQEIKDQAKILDELLREAKNLLQESKYKVREGNETLKADIEKFLKRSYEVFQDIPTSGIIPFTPKAVIDVNDVSSSSTNTPRTKRSLKVSVVQLQRKKDRLMQLKTSRAIYSPIAESEQHSDPSDSPTKIKAMPNLEQIPQLRPSKRKTPKIEEDSE